MSGKGITRKRLLLFTLPVLALVLLLALVRSGKKEQAKKARRPEEYVIKTLGNSISPKEFDKRFLQENPQIKSLRGDESYIVTLKKEFAFKLADELILFDLAADSGITVSEDEVLYELNSIQNGYSKASFNEMLDKEEITLSELMESIEKRLILKKVLDEKVYDRISIGDDETEEFYNQFKSIFYQPEKYKISKVTVEDESRAEEVLGLLESKKMKFDKAVEEYSLIAEEEDADEEEYVDKSALPEEFESALDTLKTGEITGIINTSEGYHILKLVDKTKGHIPKIAKVKDKIERMIRERKERLAYSAFMDGYREEREVVVLDDYFKVEEDEE